MKNLLIYEMSEILESKLLSDYPETLVELGENWQVIAEIFYEAGFAAASMKDLNNKNEN